MADWKFPCEHSVAMLRTSAGIWSVKNCFTMLQNASCTEWYRLSLTNDVRMSSELLYRQMSTQCDITNWQATGRSGLDHVFVSSLQRTW